jgi:hypothetical protein
MPLRIASTVTFVPNSTILRAIDSACSLSAIYTPSIVGLPLFARCSHLTLFGSASSMFMVMTEPTQFTSGFIVHLVVALVFVWFFAGSGLRPAPCPSLDKTVFHRRNRNDRAADSAEPWLRLRNGHGT